MHSPLPAEARHCCGLVSPTQNSAVGSQGLSSALGFSKRAPFAKEEDLRELGELLTAFLTS